MTEAERVARASPAARQWLEERLKRVNEFAVSYERDGVRMVGKCFFCGKNLLHVNDGGDGWHFWVNPSPGVWVESMYCNYTCQGPDASPEAAEAKRWLMWRENVDGDLGPGCSYVEVIGEQGPHGRTPETTLYRDDDVRHADLWVSCKLGREWKEDC